MILDLFLPFMSFPPIEIFATHSRIDRFLWKKRLKGGITEIHGLPARVNAIVVQAEGFSSAVTSQTWEHEIGGSALTARRRYSSTARLIKEDLGWTDGEAG
jgi:hypothetical protein